MYTSYLVKCTYCAWPLIIVLTRFSRYFKTIFSLFDFTGSSFELGVNNANVNR